MKNSRSWCAFLALIFLISTCSPAIAGGGNSVPVMTPLTVKLDQAVSVESSVNGTPFTATLKQAVEVDGQTIIPAGTSVGGIIGKDSPNTVQMELNSVFVNGRLHRITTEPVTIVHKSAPRAGATVTFRLMLSLNLAK